MWLEEEQIEIVGVLTTIFIGEDDLVFQAKFVVDDTFAKWNELTKDYTFTFKSTKQKSIDRIAAKVEKQYLELMRDHSNRDEILDKVAELLVTELSRFAKRTKRYLEFHQLSYINDVGEEKIIWQSQFFDDTYINRFFDIYD